MNLYMHNASYRPLPGYGKAQDAEAKFPLFYYRSQTDHPHRRFVDKATKVEDDTRKTSLLPRNQGAEKLVAGHDLYRNLANDLDVLDERGFPKDGQELSDKTFGYFLAYSGLRANNLAVYLGAITSLKERESVLSILPKNVSPKISKLPAAQLLIKIDALKAEFVKLTTQTVKFVFNTPLYTNLFDFRCEQAKKVVQHINVKNLQHIRLRSMGTCVFIDFYPDFDRTKAETANYKEGVTNTIMAFFGGLINHLCQQRGLHLHVDRRQSFGFLRAFLADVGGLRLRLSMGFEPAIFGEIVLESLLILDNILHYFDFRDRKNIFLLKCFEPCEKSRAKDGKPTDNTGTHLLKTMRSEEKQWLSFQDAKVYLDECLLETGSDYIQRAFEKYLNSIIEASGVKIPPKKNDYVSKTLNKYRTGYIQKISQSNIRAEEGVLLELLRSIIDYGVRFVERVPHMDQHSPYLYSLHHCMLKLYNNCNKGLSLLEHFSVLDATHLHAKASLLVENILEYLISLDAICQVINRQSKQLYEDPIEKLYRTEKEFVLEKTKSKNDVDIYFTDNGQQAITMSLVIMNDYLAGESTKKHITDGRVYVFDESYYELESFLSKVGNFQTRDKRTAKILFIDVMQLSVLKLLDFPNIESVVIDTTNQPNMSDTMLLKLIEELHRRNIFVALVSSTLKHEQLGLDKYQSGRIVMLPPAGKNLSDDLKEQLQMVSDEAMHPLIASYMQMVNEICREKVQAPEVKNAGRPALRI